MTCKILRAGKCRTIYYFNTRLEKCMCLEEWISELPCQIQRKLSSCLRIITEHDEYPKSEERFRHEFDDIYAIKCGQIRLLGLKEQGAFIVVHFLQKKANKISLREIRTIKTKAKEFKDAKNDTCG